MKTEQRTNLENVIFGVWINHINYFRGGVGPRPMPDPADRNLATLLAQGMFNQEDLEGLPSRLAGLLQGAVETGAYWALKIEAGEASLKDEWSERDFRRPLGGVPTTKLERKLTTMAEAFLGDVAPATDDEDERAVNAMVSWIAEAIYEFDTPECPTKPSGVAETELPRLHRDIIITLIEVGLHLGLRAREDAMSN